MIRSGIVPIDELCGGLQPPSILLLTRGGGTGKTPRCPPFAPLLEDGTSSPIAAASLAELLVASQATALLTYSEDLSANYDRRLEPLVQAASGVFRITRDDRAVRQLEIVTLRYSPALEAARVE